MSGVFRFVAVALTSSCVVLMGCGQKMGGEPSLSISARPSKIDDNGQVAQLTIDAIESGVGGVGKVFVSSTAGALTDEVELPLVDGAATIGFTCVLASDPGCKGSVEITATWTTGEKKVTANKLISVVPAVVDGGGVTFDAGMGMADGGIKITLTTSKTRVNLGVGDSADLTATVTAMNVPQSGRAVVFTGGGGRVSDLSGGLLADTYTGMTDATGVAKAKIWPAGDAGITSATAVDQASGATATTLIEFSLITQIQFVNIACGPDMACSVMGVKGSGFNETSLVNFKVLDSNTRPVPGVPVDCTLMNSPSGTTVSPTTTSDAMGIATCTVNSGTVIGAFTVRATVTSTALSSSSLTIGIRGATPANKGFTLQCDSVNIPTYITNTPPANINVNCRYKLVDRFNNPVGTGTSVYFKTEAGTVPDSTASTKFTPSMPNNPNEGTGTVTFSTTGPFPAVNVPPLPADSTQFPFPRTSEPYWQDTGTQRNPRDGLVSIIAYVQGEEFYSDDNSNGKWDVGEQFIDQGEPFVDANDNGVFDTNEIIASDPNNNGVWDGPDGIQNANKVIWVETRVLYTSVPSIVPSFTRALPSTYAGSCPGGLNKLDQVEVAGYLPDLNINRLSSSATLSVRQTGKMPAVSWFPTTVVDGYGFSLERRLLNADYVDGFPDAGTVLDCLPGVKRCEWKYLFGDWGTGFLGKVTIKGAGTGDMTACTDGTVQLDATAGSIRGTVTTTGGIQ